MGCSNSSPVEAIRGQVVEDKTICVGKQWTDCGKKDKHSEIAEAKNFEVMKEQGWDFTTPGNAVGGMRKFLDRVLKYDVEAENATERKMWKLYEKYVDKVTYRHRTDVGGPDYDGNAAVVDAYIVKVAEKRDLKNQRCLVFFHGGACIAGRTEQFNFYCARMAVEFDATVINVNYRLAPEHKIPCGIDDSYAAVKWVIAKTDELGIDPNKIATIGESGGGYIVAGVSIKLAEADEGHLIRFGAQLVPMVSNTIFTTPESEMDAMNKMIKALQTEIYQELCPDYEGLEASNFNDKWMFPTCIDDELCKKCPPAVILTAEFDSCLKGAQETAAIYRRNKNLILYGSQRGAHHGHHYDPMHCRTNSWHKALAKVCKIYL